MPKISSSQSEKGGNCKNVGCRCVQNCLQRGQLGRPDFSRAWLIATVCHSIRASCKDILLSHKLVGVLGSFELGMIIKESFKQKQPSWSCSIVSLLILIVVPFTVLSRMAATFLHICPFTWWWQIVVTNLTLALHQVQSSGAPYSVTGFAIWYMGSGWFGGGCGLRISLECQFSELPLTSS